MSGFPRGRAPTFVLRDAYVVYTPGSLDKVELPQGAFVQPINKDYVPKHITDKVFGFNTDVDTFAYSRFGIIVIPRRLIREL